jgi:hypothetical protein
MSLVHQTIPEEYLPAFLDRGHYFAPCSTFVDLMEFRFGYCLFNSDGSTAGLTSCIRETFKNENVNRWIDSTSVSCWTTDSDERFAMWELYGKRYAAIRISADQDQLKEYFDSETTRSKVTSGPVTYAGQVSMVRPQFLCQSNDMTEEENQIYDLFFHKHGFYTWEQEFRLILFQKGPVSIPLKPDLIQRITISPFGKLDLKLEDTFRQRFGDRVKASNLQVSYSE